MDEIEKIADAILYEGYALFPYRADALKNQKRFNFGVLAPRAWAETQKHETFFQQTECLILSAKKDFEILLKTRFLQIENESKNWRSARKLEIVKRFFFDESASGETIFDFEFSVEENFAYLTGQIKISATKIGENLFKLKMILENLTDVKTTDTDDIQVRSFLSAHTILQVLQGKFLSFLEPPEELKKAAENCANVGVFPVLVGDKTMRNVMLSSPIILYDFPEIAANSFAEFFDGTEIDELMFLSLLALTDDEKRAIRNGDEKMRKILEKIEAASPEDLLKLHASMTNG